MSNRGLLNKINNFSSKLKKLAGISSYIVYWQGKKYAIDYDTNQIIETNASPDLYCFDFDSIQYESFQLPVPPGQKVENFVIPRLRTRGIMPEDYYFFVKDFADTVDHISGTREKLVALVHLSKVEINFLQKKHKDLLLKGVVPFDFLLAACGPFFLEDKKVCAIFFIDENQYRAVLSFDGFPIEVIKDTGDAPIDFVSRTYFYFQGKYAELGLAGAIIIGLPEESREQLSTTLLTKLLIFPKKEYVLFGTRTLKIKILNHLLYFFSIFLDLASIFLFALFVYHLFLTSKSIFRESRTYSQLKSENQILEHRFYAYQKRFQKDFLSLKPKILKIQKFMVLDAFPPINSHIYIDVVNFYATIVQLQKDYHPIKVQKLKLDEIPKKPGIYKIEVFGTIFSENKSEIQQIAHILKEKLKEHHAIVKFSRNPPRPPITNFTIESVLTQSLRPESL